MKFIAILIGFLFAVFARAESSIYDISVTDIEGRETSLAVFKGKTLLIVNVASQCGFTGQYSGLQELSREYADAGLVVLGFPCNQFGGQEPGTNGDIREFCSQQYGVTFPMFAKIDVKGPNQHPLFAFLTGRDSPFPGKVGWNFSKFVVNGDGEVTARFSSFVSPKSNTLRTAIDRALAE